MCLSAIGQFLPQSPATADHFDEGIAELACCIGKVRANQRSRWTCTRIWACSLGGSPSENWDQLIWRNWLRFRSS
jgi:hypothetical protein